MDFLDSKKDAKRCKIFSCIKCAFNTSNLFNYNKHLSTRKHLLDLLDLLDSNKNAKDATSISTVENETDAKNAKYAKDAKNIKDAKDAKDATSIIAAKDAKDATSIIASKNIKDAKDAKLKCELCFREYQTSGGLRKHKLICNKQTCQKVNETETIIESQNIVIPQNVLSNDSHMNDRYTNDPMMYKLFNDMFESNKEFKQIIMEQQAKMMEMASKTTINNSNSHNKTNITVNMFLNEQCKDAMTINKFLKSINPSMDQLMHMTNEGNREGLIQIMNDSLCSMKITERPIHCTDMNRNITWVKQDDGWLKEYKQESMKRICLHINHACEKKIIKIVDDDPEYTIPRSEKHEHFLKMLAEANGGAGCKEHINAASAINIIKDRIFLGKDEIQKAIC
jgi:hypothetical protein